MSDQDPNGITPHLVRFWASMLDCFLQDFEKAVADGDQNDVMLAATKLEQAGRSMEEWFGACSVAYIESEEHEKACDAAATAVVKVIQENMDRFAGDEDGPPTARTWN